MLFAGLNAQIQGLEIIETFLANVFTGGTVSNALNLFGGNGKHFSHSYESFSIGKKVANFFQDFSMWFEKSDLIVVT